MTCRQCEGQLLEYVEGLLTEKEREAFQQHLAQSEQCKEEFVQLSSIMSSMEVEQEKIIIPPNFTDNLRRRVYKAVPRQNKFQRFKPGLWVAVIFLSFFVVGTAWATSGFSHIVDWWQDMTEKQQQRVDENIKHGFGDRLNMEMISNEVKVTITDVVADDIQTHIYYEIEDLTKQHHYMIHYSRGTEVLFPYETKVDDFYLRNHLRLFSDRDHVVKGRMGVSPMNIEEGYLTLKLTELEEVSALFEEDEPNLINQPVENKTFTGEWSFEIPIKKHPTIVKDIHIEADIEGNPLLFTKITFAPTSTLLAYQFQSVNSEEKLQTLTFSGIKNRGKKYELDEIHSGSSGRQMGSSFTHGSVSFESMYLDLPSVIDIEISRYSVSINQLKTVEFDWVNDVQEFDYLGIPISIEVIDSGNPMILKMIEEYNSDRKYEQMHYEFIQDEDYVGYGTNDSQNGLIVDEFGRQFKLEEYFFRMHELEKPRIYVTDHLISMSNEGKDEEIKKPKGINITGYYETRFIKKSIEIDLDDIR